MISREVSDVFVEHQLAKAYGWTPSDIENMPEDRIRDHLTVLDEEAKEEKRHIDAAKRGK